MTNKYLTNDELWMLMYLLIFVLLFTFIALSYGAYLEEDLSKETINQLTKELHDAQQ